MIGELHVITGTMYGGKTTDAWQKVQQYLRKGRVIAMKPETSMRQLEHNLRESSGKLYITTHNGLTISCEKNENLRIFSDKTHDDLNKSGLLSEWDSVNPIAACDVLWIDEAQFYDYDDLKQLLSLALYRFNKKVYVSMLDAYTHNTPIPHMKLLIPCKSFTVLKTLCKNDSCFNEGCIHVYTEKKLEWIENNPSKYTMKEWMNMFHSESKMIEIDNIKLKVGSDDDYSVLCISCYASYALFHKIPFM